jgi:hypothetical protein
MEKITKKKHKLYLSHIVCCIGVSRQKKPNNKNNNKFAIKALNEKQQIFPFFLKSIK